MKKDQLQGKITVAITGASGAPYALKLIQALVTAKQQVYLMVSSAARVVLATESDIQFPSKPEKASEFFIQLTNAEPGQIEVFGKDQWFSPVASGSAAPKKMVVCPCSTGSLASIGNQ